MASKASGTARLGLGTVAAVVVVIASACGEPNPDEGHYRFNADEVFADSCGFAAPPNELWQGQFGREGSLLMLSLDLHNLSLRGGYLELSDRFSLDGTAEKADTQVEGVSCRVDWIGIHLDGQAQTSQAFSGGVQITYYSLSSDVCSCALQARYTAQWEAPP